MYERSLANRLQQIADKIIAGPGPHICEVEPRDEGLWLRQVETQVIYDWKRVEALEDMAGSVDIFTADGGGVIVRDRAFQSVVERSRFIELVRAKLDDSDR